MAYQPTSLDIVTFIRNQQARKSTLYELLEIIDKIVETNMPSL